MRRQDCPAFHLNCLNCGIKGHLAKVCRKPRSGNSSTRALDGSQQDNNQLTGQYFDPQLSNVNQVTGQYFDPQVSDLSSTTSYIFVNITLQEELPLHSQSSVATSVPHLECDGEKFVEQAPKPSPLMTITIEIITDSSVIPISSPFPPGFQGKPADTSTLADSGAQTCSGDLQLLARLVV